MLLALVGALFCPACTGSSDLPDLAWLDLPAQVPPPAVPSAYPLTPERAALGRHLFYDTRLSGNGQIACSTCHQQEHAFAAADPVAVGATGERGHVNAPPLVNVAYMSPLTWSSLEVRTIEDQLVRPMFGTSPVEMDMGGHEVDIEARLNGDEVYRDLAMAAFPDGDGTLTVDDARVALAAFVRSIDSFRSPFDDYLAGDDAALSASARRGADLFYSDRLGCSTCHSGFNLTSATRSAVTVDEVRAAPLHNIGLYDVDGDGGYPADAPGLVAETGVERDRGRFRAPSLRNVSVTGPYMHDGSVATLADVLRIYEDGGRVISEGPNAGDGRANPFRSTELRDFELTDRERTDLLAFLDSLTDEALLSDPRWGDPW